MHTDFTAVLVWAMNELQDSTAALTNNKAVYGILTLGRKNLVLIPIKMPAAPVTQHPPITL